jgi:hypothetical protein
MSPSLQLSGTAGAFRASIVLWRHPYRPDNRLFDHRVAKRGENTARIRQLGNKKGKNEQNGSFFSFLLFFPLLFPEALFYQTRTLRFAVIRFVAS